MMGVTRALRRNGHIPAMDGGRGPGRQRPWCVDDGKNRDLTIAPVCEKKGTKRGVTWNFGESPPTIVMV